MILESNTQYRYTPDVGVIQEGELVFCGVCNAVMKETRNCFGPRGYAMAMAGSKTNYDEFECPCIYDRWHQQVVALRTEAKRSVSSRIAAILNEEAEEVLKARKPTKHWFDGANDHGQ